jgi:hypothetical protein
MYEQQNDQLLKARRFHEMVYLDKEEFSFQKLDYTVASSRLEVYY